MAKAFFILILIILIGAVVYVIQSGVFSKIFTFSRQLSGYLSAPSSSYNVATKYNAPVYQPVNNQQQSFNQVQNGASQSYQSVNVPEGFKKEDLSPYFGKVRIGSASPGFGFSYGQISLYANLNASDTLNITGWAFKANNGNQYIARAVDVYDPSGLAAESDIYLKANDYVNIYTNASAITKNFRLNKCMGYLENYNKFTPTLPLNCPYISRSELERFDGDCQTYIQSLGSCRLPDSNPPVRGNENDCRYYIDHTLNYLGCFEKYRTDADFLSHEWRIWTNNQFIDEIHDRILLLDRNGLLVDIYSY